MQYFYLLRSNGTYSDVALYDGTPTTRDEGVWVAGKPSSDLKPYIQRDFNKQLEDAFMGMLPKHDGKPYVTPQVAMAIGAAKQAITDFNRLGLFNYSALVIQSLELPPEMEEDKQAFIAMLGG